MNLLVARAGRDLRQTQIESYRRAAAAPPPTVAAAPAHAWLRPLQGLRQWLRRAGQSRALTAELTALGDTALADLGIRRSQIPALVRQMAAQRRPRARIALADTLDPHLQDDIAVRVTPKQLHYLITPLGITRTETPPADPANSQRRRRVA
jgi:uncharacterized protein YjiS (DUF1127 family)